MPSLQVRFRSPYFYREVACNHSFFEHSENICFHIGDKLLLTNLNKKKFYCQKTPFFNLGIRGKFILVNRYPMFLSATKHKFTQIMCQEGFLIK